MDVGNRHLTHLLGVSLANEVREMPSKARATSNNWVLAFKMKNTYKRLFIPNNPTSLRICPELAEEIGLNESIVLLQIEFLISISNHVHDDRRWTYQSVRELKEKYFPFWNESTIKRTIQSLITKGLLIRGNYNKASYDKTNWYAMVYDNVKNLASLSIGANCTNGLVQNGPIDSGNLHQPIPETTAEITTENIKNSYSSFLAIGAILKNKKEPQGVY